jgi:hypothetical protein
LAGENEEALTAVSSKGDADIIVGKNVEKDRRQIVCMEIESEGQTKVQNEPCEQGAFGKGMLDNDTYNLMEQLEIENRSLWRIKNNYKKDASMNNESKQLWNFIEKDKEEVGGFLQKK